VSLKVLGVGLGKTGTTSLNRAFEILGFTSRHLCAAEVLEIIGAYRQAGQSPMTGKKYRCGQINVFFEYPHTRVCRSVVFGLASAGADRSLTSQ
jgi:hypothetical protein